MTVLNTEGLFGKIQFQLGGKTNIEKTLNNHRIVLENLEVYPEITEKLPPE